MQKLRPLTVGKYYHIYNRGINRENIFREDRNYPFFLNLYARYVEPIAETFAYCLLGNHFHLLVRIASAEPDPTQQFSNLFNAYAKAINKTYSRTGSLFEGRFGRLEVTDPAYFGNLVTYIHRNPQKHGFCTDFRDYPYSSYGAMLADRKTRIHRQDVLAWFGSREALLTQHASDPDMQAAKFLVEFDE